MAAYKMAAVKVTPLPPRPNKATYGCGKGLMLHSIYLETYIIKSSFFEARKPEETDDVLCDDKNYQMENYSKRLG
jgi:hypothetical protein